MEIFYINSAAETLKLLEMAKRERKAKKPQQEQNQSSLLYDWES